VGITRRKPPQVVKTDGYSDGGRTAAVATPIPEQNPCLSKGLFDSPAFHRDMVARRRRISRRGFLGTLAVAGTAGCLGSSGSDPLRMGVVPDVDPDSAIEANTPLKNYLAATLDREVRLRTTTDYAGLVRAMTADELDLAYFGGVSYILAHERAGAEAIVVGESNGSTRWHSAVIVPENSEIESMADVGATAEDLELVFGDPISTSGTVMPTYYLRTEFDLDPKTDFEAVTHVGAHDATARTISSGNGDVGALNARIYDALLDSGSVSGAREIWRSPPFADYPWAVAPAVSSDTRSQLRSAFLKLDDRNRTDVLSEQNVDRYVEIDHEAFSDLETAVEMAGLSEFDGA
jgi:phosphonate transport system substrate-binding protein